MPFAIPPKSKLWFSHEYLFQQETRIALFQNYYLNLFLTTVKNTKGIVVDSEPFLLDLTELQKNYHLDQWFPTFCISSKL